MSLIRPIIFFSGDECAGVLLITMFSVNGKFVDSTRTAFAYAAFAIIAIAANIGAQDLTVRVYRGPLTVWVSVVVGTGVGLVVKYVLDKRYIFRFIARDVAHDTRVFTLYALMGLATTAIFWGFEFGFEHLFETKEMRYLGGVIGLTIGYLTKYWLDKRYVFRTLSA